MELLTVSQVHNLVPMRALLILVVAPILLVAALLWMNTDRAPGARVVEAREVNPTTPLPQMTEEQKRDYLIKNGLDPEKYDVIVSAPQPERPAWLERARYQISTGKRTFYSEKEPEQKSGMLKFIDLRNGKETQVSTEGIVVTKLR